jgi:hypothetical protein
VVDLGAERLAVVVDGRLEVVDGDGDVVDLGEQRAGGAGWADCTPGSSSQGRRVEMLMVVLSDAVAAEQR